MNISTPNMFQAITVNLIGLRVGLYILNNTNYIHKLELCVSALQNQYECLTGNFNSNETQTLYKYCLFRLVA